MATSDVDVYSKALMLLALSPVDSFEETGADRGKSLFGEQHYEQIRDALIAEYPWRCFLTKAKLTRETAAPTSEYKYSFLLPPDIIGGPVAVYNDNSVGADPVTTHWETFQRTILADWEELWIDYKQAKSEDQWPAYFVQLMIYELAWNGAYPLKQDINLGDYWKRVARGTAAEQMKGGYYRTATQADAMQTTPKQFQDFSLIEARAGADR